MSSPKSDSSGPATVPATNPGHEQKTSSTKSDSSGNIVQIVKLIMALMSQNKPQNYQFKSPPAPPPTTEGSTNPAAVKKQPVIDPSRGVTEQDVMGISTLVGLWNNVQNSPFAQSLMPAINVALQRKVREIFGKLVGENNMDLLYHSMNTAQSQMGGFGGPGQMSGVTGANVNDMMMQSAMNIARMQDQANKMRQNMMNAAYNTTDFQKHGQLPIWFNNLGNLSAVDQLALLNSARQAAINPPMSQLGTPQQIQQAIPAGSGVEYNPATQKFYKKTMSPTTPAPAAAPTPPTGQFPPTSPASNFPM